MGKQKKKKQSSSLHTIPVKHIEILLSGRWSCRTETDSVRRAKNRALGAESDEMRNAGRVESSEEEFKCEFLIIILGFLLNWNETGFKCVKEEELNAILKILNYFRK